jgi:hypothetical protein
MGGFDDRAAAPRRHRGQVYVTGDDHKRAHGQSEVKNTVVLPVGAVSYGLRRIGQTTAGGIGHLNEDRDVLVDLTLGSADDVPKHTPGVGSTLTSKLNRGWALGPEGSRLLVRPLVRGLDYSQQGVIVTPGGRRPLGITSLQLPKTLHAG